MALETAKQTSSAGALVPTETSVLKETELSRCSKLIKTWISNQPEMHRKCGT